MVRDLYSAFGQGDIPTLLKLLDPAVDWHVAGTAQIPFAGKYRGHDGVKRFFAEFDRTTETQEFRPIDFLADRDKVVVLGTERLRVKANGAIVTNEWTHVFTFRNERIVQFRSYDDTEALVTAFRSKRGE